MEDVKINLDMFAVVWNQHQNQTTPSIHLRILNWLEKSLKASDTRLLLMAFRACGKSTLVGIFCAWRIFCNPNLRIMIMAADDVLACKMARNIRRILERHPLTSGLKPKTADQWSNDRFTVNRSGELRDPTVIARGVTSNITGARADLIIYDDVEVPNTSSTVEARNDLRDRLNESRFILTPNGMQLYVGTPHTYDTIYAVSKGNQNPDQREPFLDEFNELKVPIIDDDGNSQWPDRFLISEIKEMKKQVGPNKFVSQMMLEPVNITQGKLDPLQLNFYKSDLNYFEVMQKPILNLNNKKLASCSAWWDPSFGSLNGDASVWALVFADEDGNYYLHHIEYIRTDANDDDDEATQQCKIISSLCSMFHVPSVTIEINGIGKFLPAILRRELRSSGIYCSVVEHSSRIPKAQRILESFDAVMAAEALHVHDNVKRTPFLTEMKEWKPTSKNGRDDGLDAVAGALSQEAIRIDQGVQKGIRKSWQSTSKIFKAKT